MCRMAIWVQAHFGLTLASVAVVGFAIRVGYLLVVGPHAPIGLDAAWYSIEGHAIADGRGYVDPRVYLSLGRNVPTANFPPLWPMVLAAADHLGLGSTWSNRLVGAFFGAITVAVSGLLGCRIAGKVVGIVTAVLVACCPMLIAADASLMSESLYVLLVVSSVLLAYRALDHPTVLRFAAVGATIGLAAITRADALLLAPILLVAMVWRCSPRRQSLMGRVGLAASYLVVVALPVVAWSGYSSSRMGGLVITTSNSGNMLTGANCHSTYYGRLIGAWDQRCALDLKPGENEREWVAHARRVGIDYAKAHPARLPIVAVSRVLRVWGIWDPVQQSHLEAIESRNYRWQLVAWGYDLVMGALAIGGAVLLRRRRTRLAPLVAVVVAVLFTAALSNGNQRFRLAADPILAVGAAVALTTMVDRRASRIGT